MPSEVYTLLAVGASAGCVALGSWAERDFGRKDPARCSLDEWAGQALTLAIVTPWAGRCSMERLLFVAGLAFVTFRVFDIVKPLPAGRLQRLKGGWGILLDDLIASVYAAAVTLLIIVLWPWS